MDKVKQKIRMLIAAAYIIAILLIILGNNLEGYFSLAVFVFSAIPTFVAIPVIIEGA